MLKEIVKTALKNPLLLRRKEYIFIVGHMRSYSSLLAHLMGSHETISGYLEMHRSYGSYADLFRMRRALYQESRKALGARFLLDKVLHHRDYSISDGVLKRSDVHVLLLLREPASTFKSVVNMKENITKVYQKANLEKELDYYCSQLTYMQSIGELLGEKAMFVEAETLKKEPEQLLAALQQWLDLDQPFQTEYETFRHSGKKGYGDPSEKIRSGKIIRDTSRYDAIAIEPAILEKAQKAYDECRGALLKYCTTPENLIIL